ncbi:MAG: substrate-binding domain-containing protein [Mobilicoccus sp.]|nr:substrate-binding domain-containing protein [Mobilicoccus sp.]
MTPNRRRISAAVALAATTALALTACSSEGGRQTTGGEGGGGQVADTPQITIAMITHEAPGDAFWNIIRRGAETAANKDNVNLEYSNDPDATRQAQLIQAAIDKGVDGIAVTSPNTGALGPNIRAAVAAGIPVTMFNAGGTDAMELGAIGYFGQEEMDAGRAVGERLVADGAQKTICVIQEQGQQQLEDRCQGVAEGAQGSDVERIYVNGRDPAAVTTTIEAKLTQDQSVDHIVTLGAQWALNAVQAVEGSGRDVSVGTFDTNAELVTAIQNGDVAWAIDQQPYLQGYMAIDALWLYKTNGNTLGGGGKVATGPAFIDADNVEAVAEFAAGGTR